MFSAKQKYLKKQKDHYVCDMMAINIRGYIFLHI